MKKYEKSMGGVDMATKKSYEVRFGINDTEVSKQLANIDKSLKGTQGELKLLKTNLSENWDKQGSV